MRYSTLMAGMTFMALGVSLSLPADAVTQSRRMRSQGGPPCQLSVPTTDTKVRPKSVGMRNEGTTSAFVICGLPAPAGEFTGFSINVLTIDGLDHVVSCTGVNGSVFSGAAYATKNVSTGTSTTVGTGILWTAADFGGTAGNDMPGDGYFSVTCTLPAQTSIPNVYADYNEDVGT